MKILKINNFTNEISKIDINIFLLFLISSFILWHPILSNHFLNDDFQVLGWLKPQILADVFKPFYEKEPILFYWRPIVNFLNSLTIYIFGFKPLPFLVQNLIVYSFISFLVFKILKKIGANSETSFLFSLIFFALPSHDLPIAWLACRFDLFMTLFILLAIYFYLKLIYSKLNNIKLSFFLVFLFSFLSIFSKEHSFFLIGFGLIMFIIEPKKRNYHLIFSSMIAFFIILYFLLRMTLIGGNPFSSTNFANINFLDIVTNFFIYIISSLIHPELFLNFFRHNELDLIFISQTLLALTIGILFIFAIVRNKILFSLIDSKRTSENIEFKLFFFGFLLYVFSVIPVLPLYMRWYSFFPFIGVIFLVSGVFEYLKNKYPSENTQEKSSINRRSSNNFVVLRLLIFIYMSICFIFNYLQAKSWNLASKEVKKVLNSLSNKEIIKADTITLWGIPEKIEGINAMKLGVEQAVHYAIKNETINVKAPLRMECDEQYSMNITKINDTSFRFALKGGILRHQFTNRFNIDSVYYDNDEYSLKINNNTYYSEKSGFAILIFKKRVYGNPNLVWTGERFIEF